MHHTRFDQRPAQACQLSAPPASFSLQSHLSLMSRSEDVVFVDEHSARYDDGVEADEEGYDDSDEGGSEGKGAER